MKYDSVKRRREERLRQLREQMKTKQWSADFSQEEEYGGLETRFYPVYSMEKNESFDDEWEPEEENNRPSKHNKNSGAGSKFLIKGVLALFLLSVVYLLNQTNVPFSDKAKSLVKEALTRDYNFSGTVAMVEQFIGKSPEILPTFSVQNKGDKPAWNQTKGQQAFEKPVSGAVVSPFVMDGKGIQIETQAGSDVKAIGQGWVIFIGQKEGLGQTVIVQHGDHTQSWYSNIDTIRVNEQDWVQPGQVLGKVKKGKNLYFSMLRDDHYLDPTSVISFD